MTRPLPAADLARPIDRYVGTLVGEATCRDFRLSVAHDSIREQDLIALDAELRSVETNALTPVRVWAKVQSIERVNPLFPLEAGHELAETRTDPLGTVLSLSREMVTAVCHVLGVESEEGRTGRLDHLRYPPRPATSAYRPNSDDIARVVVGDLAEKRGRALDLATLANRSDVDVLVDGHAIVTRHLAILAMTGAGKSWTSRRIIEQLAEKNYPIVIFDPHGDYTGLGDVSGIGKRVRRFYAHFPIFDEDSETVASIVSSLAYELSNTMRTRFGEVFAAARKYLPDDPAELKERTDWLIDRIGKSDIREFGLHRNLWLVSYLAEAGDVLVRDRDREGLEQLADWCWPELRSYTPTDARTLEGIKKRSARAAWTLSRMEQTNRRIAGEAEPLPTDRRELVQHGKISIVSLAGYTSDFQATIYTVIAEDLFGARVRNDLAMPVLLVLEEAHTFAPGRALTGAEQRAVITTRQIAQEGRKFNVGLVLISQRPSRLDETTLSQCNSYVIMRLVNPADQNFVCKVIETMGESEARMLPDLDVGEALLAGQMINFPVLARIKPPQSKGEREEEDAFALLERMRTQKPTAKSTTNGMPMRKPR